MKPKALNGNNEIKDRKFNVPSFLTKNYTSQMKRSSVDIYSSDKGGKSNTSSITNTSSLFSGLKPKSRKVSVADFQKIK